MNFIFYLSSAIAIIAVRISIIYPISSLFSQNLLFYLTSFTYTTEKKQSMEKVTKMSWIPSGKKVSDVKIYFVGRITLRKLREFLFKCHTMEENEKFHLGDLMKFALKAPLTITNSNCNNILMGDNVDDYNYTIH